jgi:BirA family biotin operon repressor/biotin-[acetyl-CoA-carboxylase] ligase
MTLIERPADAGTVELWSVRFGIHAARALDPYATARVGVKWPNDLYVAAGKVAGILVEARWQDQRVLWVAVGIGINVRAPGELFAAGLRPGTSRLDVLTSIVHALRDAACANGPLTSSEAQEWRDRDITRGRRCTEPAVGRVAGIGARGELLVDVGGATQAFRSGSLVLSDAPEAA